MTQSSPTFAERLRVALGLRGLGLDGGETPRSADRTARPGGTSRPRGQDFADRLRRALGQD